MAEEKPAEKPSEDKPAEKPAAKTPPTSSDIVSDNHAKSIRTLEDKLSASEKVTQDLKGELKQLQEIVRKANEIKTPLVTDKPKTILQALTDLIEKGSF